MFDAFKIDQFDVLGEGEPVPAAFADEIQRKWEVAEPFGEGRELGSAGRLAAPIHPTSRTASASACSCTFAAIWVCRPHRFSDSGKDNG